MKRNLFGLLLFLFGWSLLRLGGGLIPHFLIIVGSAYLADSLLTRLRKIPSFFPWAALVSGMIIAFVLDPASPVVFQIAAPVLAILSKHLILFKGRHLFNPAAFGLFFAALFGAPLSWWVGGFGFWADLLLLAGMFFILRPIRKVSLVLAFFIAFWALKLLIFQELTFWFSLLFFPLVMLPEPLTSPSERRAGLVYGALAALFVLFFRFSQLVPVDPFIQSLLLVNLMNRVGWLEKAVVFLRI